MPRTNDLTRVSGWLSDRGARLVIADKREVRATVRVGHSGDALCLRFRVDEPTVRGTVSEANGEVYEDSCVECFLSLGAGHEYYNLEMNCIGTPLLGYGIGRGRRRRLDPSVMSRIRISSSLGSTPFSERPTGEPWELVAVVPVSVFQHARVRSLGGTCGRANFYKCGDLLSNPHWESWSPVRTPTPDFHRPEFFAPLRFA
jgi:hypothetical protein